MRRNYKTNLNRPLLIHRVGGASKVCKGFQLEQMQLFNSVEVIEMAYFFLMEPICPNILLGLVLTINDYLKIFVNIYMY